MEITKENEDIIINCGAFGYDAKKISNIIGVKEQYVLEELKNEKSILSILIQKGKDMADYVIDLKLFEMAKSGDIKALETLDYRKRLRTK